MKIVTSGDVSSQITRMIFDDFIKQQKEKTTMESVKYAIEGEEKTPTTVFKLEKNFALGEDCNAVSLNAYQDGRKMNILVIRDGILDISGLAHYERNQASKFGMKLDENDYFVTRK